MIKRDNKSPETKRGLIFFSIRKFTSLICPVSEPKPVFSFWFFILKVTLGFHRLKVSYNCPELGSNNAYIARRNKCNPLRRQDPLKHASSFLDIVEVIVLKWEDLLEAAGISVCSTGLEPFEICQLTSVDTVFKFLFEFDFFFKWEIVSVEKA